MPRERLIVPRDDEIWRAVLVFLMEENEIALLPFWNVSDAIKDSELLACLPVTQKVELEEDTQCGKKAEDEYGSCSFGVLHEPFDKERDKEQQDKRGRKKIGSQRLKVRERLKNGIHILTLS